jgi:hypothetical protein
MRLVAAAFLVVVALVAGAFAWGALQNLFASYKDSPIATYLLIGLPWLALCLAALYGAARLFRT